MTLARPPEAAALGQSNGQRAEQIYGHYCWLVRWSDEIGADADINYKKVAQLGLIHCRRFSQLTAGMTPELLAAVRRRFDSEGLALPTAAELAALRQQCDALHAWVRDNAPEMRPASQIVYSPDSDGGIEQVVTVPKPHPVEAPVASLRALFT